MPSKKQESIDLNSTDEKSLIKNLKISSRLAKRIIAFRPYDSVEQLNKIWGIDPEILKRIIPLVSVSGQSTQLGAIKEDIPSTSRKKTALPKAVKKDEVTSQPVESNVGKVKTNDVALEEKREWSISTLLSTIKLPSIKFNTWLILILLIGAYFRFTGLNWDDGEHQHPDERYISMVAEQIRKVDGVATYFDTDNSTLNPLNHGSYTYGMFPLFLTRFVAERMEMAGYDTVTLVGRAMSGVFDLLAVLMIYFLGKHLYNQRIGLLAAALGAASVLPIQLSHYFTVDSFSTIFVIASFYFATLAIPIHSPEKKISRSNLYHFALFGFVVGLAGACKVNTLPVFSIIAIAGIAWLITEWKNSNFRDDVKLILIGWFIATVFVAISFRIFQPYAFSGPGFFGVQLNPDWLRVLKEVVSQVAGDSDWPPNTHWTNRSGTYAWLNMVLWGLGLPLGLAGWFGWAWAGAQIFDGKWRSHLLPFFWVAVYFIWQNGQFWRYMRYFLPIYPFIILFAAWFLMEIYERTRESRLHLLSTGYKISQQFSDLRFTWKSILVYLALVITVLGTYIYAVAFTQIYNRPMTRIAASEWILENIPGPMNFVVESSEATRSYPVSIDNRQLVVPGETGFANINIIEDGTISKITTTDIQQMGVSIYFRLTRDEAGEQIITEGRLGIQDDISEGKQEIWFGNISLSENEVYYFHYRIQSSSEFSLSNVVFENSDQNEELKLPVNLNIVSQVPGNFQGSFSLQPNSPTVVNRFVIQDFQQVFVPTETTFKVSLYKQGGEDVPVLETSQVLNFSEPGVSISPTLVFSPVEVQGGESYQVRYEILSGAPFQMRGEKFTLETSWDDALPLNINHYNAQGGIYTPMNLELYEPDTVEKREAMIRILDESNYIVIPSNRAYDAMPRLPARYPLALRYYQELFNCDCSGDELENIAYGLKPPFKSPLGFDLIQVFVSPPSIGFLTFPDYAADESFTVYDHPKVLIFKKSQDFSIDHVREVLTSVNLDDVFFQTPKEFTQAPTAMQLPADRLSAQTAGGTWAEMFNRDSVLNNNDLLVGVAWYLLLLLIGLTAFPYIFNISSALPDRGYPLIRMGGLALIAWLAWILSSFKIVSFSFSALWIYVGFFLLLTIITIYRQREEVSSYFKSNWKVVFWTEILFLALFLFSLNIRLGNPDIWHPWLGGEKPMDFAFFNAVLKAVYFPPAHPWFSGHYINYYYYGYVIAAIPTKLLGVIPSIAYNLILPSWFAMTGVGLSCIIYNIVSSLHKPALQPDGIITEVKPKFSIKQLIGNYLPGIAAVSAVIFILLFGNLYQARVLWKYLPEVATNRAENPLFFDTLRDVVSGAVNVLTTETKLPGDNGRWYFEASRPILHDGPDTPIAEFPYFTFLYGDMHPHLLIMPFYALALGWMLNLLLQSIASFSWKKQILYFLCAGLFFGIYRGSHTWDFPTFLGLGILAIAWNIWNFRGDSLKRTLQLLILYEIAFIGIAISFYAPFAEWFKTEYASLAIWEGAKTPLIDYLFVYGLSIFICVSLLIIDLRAKLIDIASFYIKTPFNKWKFLHYFSIIAPVVLVIGLWKYDYEVLAFGIPILIGIAYLVLFNQELNLFRKIVWVLFGIAISLTLFVEVFVLKGDGGRSNTVFRFYNQAWFFFGMAMSLALVNLVVDLPRWTNAIRRLWLVSFSALLLIALAYPLTATNRKMIDRWPNIQNPPHKLDGALYMLGDLEPVNNASPAIYNDEERLLNLGYDYDAILFMQDNIKGSPVLVEGNTTEYRWGSRFSIYTGLPSVAGWSWHVRQHNSLLDGAIVERRIIQLNDFYNTTDIAVANLFLNKFNVKYIVVGDLERAYYSSDGINKFTKMVEQGYLKIIFGNNQPGETMIFEVITTGSDQ